MMWKTQLLQGNVRTKSPSSIPRLNPACCNRCPHNRRLKKCNFETIQLPCQNKRLQGSWNCHRGELSQPPITDQRQSESPQRDEGSLVFLHLCQAGGRAEQLQLSAALRFYLGIPPMQPDQQSFSQEGGAGGQQ